MAVFTVGQLVVGLPNNGYGVTSNECLLEVTEVEEMDGTQYFTGKMIAHKQKKCKSAYGSEYATLPSAMFKVASEWEIKDIQNAGIKADKPKPAEEFKMKSDLVIKYYEDGRIESSFNRAREVLPETDDTRITALKKIMDTLRGKKNNEVFAYNLIGLSKNKEFSCFDDIFSEKEHVKALDELIKFFLEFQFEPNFRFLNTLGFKAIQDVNDAKTYVKNYFKLTNSPYVTGIEDKMKSQEFKEILYFIALADPSEVVNKRFKIYYGSQGTGKTTKAIEETDGRCVVCNNSMLPQDLMEDFIFDDGKPGFHPSELCKCMTNGLPITLDEINLLPFETIRFLQGILDGKKQFIWKGNTITIKDGFSIIGTMNLMVNGMAFGLPEPLVDRCSDIKESALSGKDLLSALR